MCSQGSRSEEGEGMATWGIKESFMETWHLMRPLGDGGKGFPGWGNEVKRGTEEGEPHSTGGKRAELVGH